jgi:hypothetical protein
VAELECRSSPTTIHFGMATGMSSTNPGTTVSGVSAADAGRARRCQGPADRHVTEPLIAAWPGQTMRVSARRAAVAMTGVGHGDCEDRRRPGGIRADGCARRVPSRNQRMTSTACLEQPSARVPARVPHRGRSMCSRRETNNTVPSHTLSVAVYVAPILDAEPSIKLIFGRTSSYPGSASLRCTQTTSACRTPPHRQLPTVTAPLHGIAHYVSTGSSQHREYV